MGSMEEKEELGVGKEGTGVRSAREGKGTQAKGGARRQAPRDARRREAKLSSRRMAWQVTHVGFAEHCGGKKYRFSFQ